MGVIMFLLVVLMWGISSLIRVGATAVHHTRKLFHTAREYSVIIAKERSQ